MGARHLTWVMNKVAGYECLLPFRSDPHTHMAGSMTGGRLEPHFIAEHVIGLDPGLKKGISPIFYSSLRGRPRARIVDCSAS